MYSWNTWGLELLGKFSHLGAGLLLDPTCPWSQVNLISVNMTILCSGTVPKYGLRHGSYVSEHCPQEAWKQPVQPRKWAALFPFHHKCYTVDVETGRWQDGCCWCLPSQKNKQNNWHSYEVDSMDMFHIDAGTRRTVMNLNKSSRADVASGFLCLYWWFANQLSGYCHPLYWILYICKLAHAWKVVTNVKADLRVGRDRGAIVLRH